MASMEKGKVINMRIAVCVNAEEITSNLEDSHLVKVYEQKEEQWISLEEFPCSFELTNGISAAKDAIAKLLIQLKDCKVFVAAKISGQLYYLLESSNFNSYEAEGHPLLFLDSIYENEIKEMIQKASNEAATSTKTDLALTNFFVEEIDQPGYYNFNLKSALLQYPELSSKKLLKPFLKKRDFKELNILCDHCPKWFETELHSMALQYSTLYLTNNECQIRISLLDES
ncbi:MAG: Fe-only nitrogenase accessory protein AnfO [Mobilitalea sp.]